MGLVTSEEIGRMAKREAPLSEAALPSQELRLEDFFRLAAKLMGASGGRIQLVRNEADEEATPMPDAAEFLKVDGKRVGRDLRIYAFQILIEGAEGTLVRILEEVLIPIRSRIPEAYDAVKQDMVALGEKIFEPEFHSRWGAVLE